MASLNDVELPLDLDNPEPVYTKSQIEPVHVVLPDFSLQRWLPPNDVASAPASNIQLSVPKMACDSNVYAIQPSRSDSSTKISPNMNPHTNQRCLASHLSGTCAWLQPVFQEPGASRLIAVDSSIRYTTRLEAPSSDCTRSPDEISTIGFSTKN
ncbi:hypothetical protein F511_34716 [Dorcoceras hygrometricum]|uniref:Uncharacterized protein n=1 Tax=Dorcoceras hygrometricum TaxID=472368 RepID=A0A2Z7BNK5_9LAMI|nr:hypothetical protein F511_34716 [Dorcoceras hygrometricum]